MIGTGIGLLAMTWRDLPAVNASLNALATVLLLAGYVLIKRRRERAHKWVMLTAFAVSTIFLSCYLTYHYKLRVETGGHGMPFQGPPPISYIYYTILITHVTLAATVPVLAIWSIVTGLRDRRTGHRRISKWTWPIWLYVSVTGVVIYAMLYHVYPAPPADPIIVGDVTTPGRL